MGTGWVGKGDVGRVHLGRVWLRCGLCTHADEFLIANTATWLMQLPTSCPYLARDGGGVGESRGAEEGLGGSRNLNED